MQLVDVVRRQRTKAETHFRLRCDHVGLDPALDAADVEAQAGQPTEAAMRFALDRSEEHTSELQSLMRISYAVFCLKKKKSDITQIHTTSKYSHRRCIT